MEEQYFDEPEEMEDEEISMSDRMIGVLAEPTKLFGRLAKGEAKATDWLIPLLLTIIVAVAMQFIITSNPSLKQQATSKQLAIIEEQFDSAVESGSMTQTQADEQMEMMRDNMDKQMATGVIINTVAIVIMSFLIFFVISAYFILGAKFGLKGEGTYMEGLSAFGLPGYINVLQFVLTIILMIAVDSIEAGTNLAKLLGMDVKEMSGYFVSYIDPLKIWFYATMAIGLAKMNKSDDTAKYMGFVFGSWIIFGAIFFFASEAVPFLKNFIQ